ncbi:hypothetical protein G9A89_015135 [Geosiphon pyriformis]|nr:hypothetical protein G9A89_015135 [Geosiphon pyriformis]
MSLADEISFATQFLGALSSRAVKYPQDFSPPIQTRLRPVVKTPGFSKTSKAKDKSSVSTVDFDSPRDTKNAQGQFINVKVKSLKGGSTFTIQLSPNDTVLTLKEKIHPFAEISPTNQRLILKGKGLMDTKTLANYGIKNDTLIHLVQKAGSVSSPLALQSSTDIITTTTFTESQEIPTNSEPASLSATSEKIKNPHLSTTGNYIAKEPRFWLNLRDFLQEQFKEKGDADRVLKDFMTVYKDILGDVKIEELERIANSDGSNPK